MYKQIFTLVMVALVNIGTGYVVGRHTGSGADRGAANTAVAPAAVRAGHTPATRPGTASDKYWVVQYVNRGNPLDTVNSLIRSVDGKLIGFAVPEAYRGYFTGVKEGEVRPLPPHVDDWNSHPVDPRDRVLVTGGLRDLTEETYVRAIFLFMR